MKSTDSRNKTIRVLCLNPGSSSFKWALYPSITHKKSIKGGKVSLENLSRTLLEDADIATVSIVIIRFVHGGIDFYEPMEITGKVYEKLWSMKSISPLHMDASLQCSKLIKTNFPGAKQVAVFDTEVFRNLPESAQLYGLSKLLRDKYGIRRFGFHGFAHAGMIASFQALSSASPCQKNRIVTIQLGSGCSMAAFLDGVPVECSMGFTPNDGLLMSTRSGDVDAGLITWLQRQEGWTPDETDRYLNEESGWSGMSGKSADFSQLLRSHEVDAQEAIKLFIHRIRMTLGSYFAVLGGLDVVLLSGGIAENAVEFVYTLLLQFEHMGIDLLPDVKLPINGRLTEKYLSLSAPHSNVQVQVIQNNEFGMMLKMADRVISK